MTILVFVLSLLGAMALGMPIAFALIACGVALMLFMGNFDTQILAASIRSPNHVTQVALAGSDVATIPPDVIRKLANHPLTNSGIEGFVKDWASTGQSIRVPVDQISFRSRSAGGVKVLNTGGAEEVVSVARVAEQAED